MRRIGLAVGAMVVGVLCVAGCSGGSGSALRSAGTRGYDAAGGAASVPSPQASRAAVAGNAPAAEPAAGAASGDGYAAAGGSSARLSSGAKIRTAEIEVTVKRGALAARADQADAIAQRAGGEIDADNRTSGAEGTARLTLRVPPEQLTAVLAALSRLGHEESRSLSTKDVTTQVADVAARVTSARAAIDRLVALYARGGKVSDIIAIESELAQRQADLESLEAQQKALADETTLATVSVYLRTAPAAAAKHHQERTGFLGGLSRGWHAFTHAARAVATGAGAAVPFLVLVVLALLAARLLWTHRPRRGVTPPPADA